MHKRDSNNTNKGEIQMNKTFNKNADPAALAARQLAKAGVTSFDDAMRVTYAQTTRAQQPQR